MVAVVVAWTDPLEAGLDEDLLYANGDDAVEESKDLLKSDSKLSRASVPKVGCLDCIDHNSRIGWHMVDPLAKLCW
ncbi:hypothetical protein GUJ93_ZPchr0006g46195 [Zizania palustris]|uniref:Uncharacterized protein n=1 Tax=Zizania palustris TaxID=103762 RepID=A0A8J5W517_ZIZPA|nr:hypothetical protein GUJ93_ZPchr0006g46195 [Zizania palustris]